MKTKVKYRGHTLSIKEEGWSDELFAFDYWKMCIDLYEKLGYVNKTAVKVKGGVDGPTKLTSHDA